ncbi:acetyl/propionyl/methylcrotonyl-CoA carboxylase subunit alpha [Arthrobacter crystallopoietes]|uniref:acetyl/propionyl/methylcrotonyl-CoA carboxylase subunit alpha n=1 Tax=Crystallibacter crystallopoietes TaxID=37928 RepID=UPI001ABEAD56|nr:biotin carboxylase N-terminal domain-containing protein [Arthrobacter crystallopoietes]QTG79782.1 acetyl/propionyl-CoA carboxylase subunit alpha [Arthrobacter crystallopoietes]
MPEQLFTTVLIANRGEIACRVIRTCRRLGIRTVAVYSDADAGARHVREADLAVRIGPPAPTASYLNIEAIISACRRTGAEAVHPGYGFLSESLAFAEALEAAGITFIGPNVKAIGVMGDKIRSKNHVAGYQVPVVPGLAEPGLSDEQLINAADGVGYPLLIKPSAGGGGKGMHVVDRPDQLPATLATARRVAASAFGDDTLFLEKLIRSPRHIEVQVLADNHGNVIHLGERECSLQRRHQKVIEEAPSPLLDEATRARIGEAACNAARSVDYSGAGTVEFLVSDEAPDQFYFMEMNTRLQVEHPVTELVTGLDLVEWQLRIAAGGQLTIAQSDVVLIGHAVEARVYAENPEQDFLPSAGTVLALHEASGEGIRVDSSLLPGLEISSSYDPMLAKVIAWGEDREEALDRLDRALGETVVLGVPNNVEYLRLLVNDDDVRAGHLDTTLIERKLPHLAFRRISGSELAVAAVAWLEDSRASRQTVPPGSPWTAGDGWRVGGAVPTVVSFAMPHGEPREVALTRMDSGSPGGVASFRADVAGSSFTVSLELEAGAAVVNGVRQPLRHAVDPGTGTIWLADAGFSAGLTVRDRKRRLAEALERIHREEGELSPEVRSPMPGTVTAVAVGNGEHVEAGQTVLTVEAMKMEHQLTAAVAGEVSIHLKPGDLVKAGQIVAVVAAADPAGGTEATEQKEAEHA